MKYEVIGEDLTTSKTFAKGKLLPSRYFCVKLFYLFIDGAKILVSYDVMYVASIWRKQYTLHGNIHSLKSVMKVKEYLLLWGHSLRWRHSCKYSQVFVIIKKRFHLSVVFIHSSLLRVWWAASVPWKCFYLVGYNIQGVKKIRFNSLGTSILEPTMSKDVHIKRIRKWDRNYKIHLYLIKMITLLNYHKICI